MEGFKILTYEMLSAESKIRQIEHVAQDRNALLYCLKSYDESWKNPKTQNIEAIETFTEKLKNFEVDPLRGFKCSTTVLRAIADMDDARNAAGLQRTVKSKVQTKAELVREFYIRDILEVGDIVTFYPNWSKTKRYEVIFLGKRFFEGREKVAIMFVKANGERIGKTNTLEIGKVYGIMLGTWTIKKTGKNAFVSQP